jgi:sigma-B regulation protein RsbU (phosphoserine phosphatase)
MSHVPLSDIPAPCWVTDGQGVLRRYNARLAEWAGLPDPGAQGDVAVTMTDWLTPAGRIFFETHVWPTLRRDGLIVEIFAYWQPGGRRSGAYVSAKRMEHDAEPQYLWLLFAAEDRQAFEQALIQARQRAQSQAEQLQEAHARLRLLNGQIQRQIHQTQAENRTLSELAAHDPLTGLGNRRSLQALSQALASRPAPRRPYAVLMIDIDHFKAINDQHGHARGDAVLAGVAECLRRCARQSDTVVRYGGEEFTLVLPDADVSQALVVAARAHEEIARARPGGLAVTVSIGAAAALSDDADLYEVLQHADEALYAAKSQGRNTTVCHSSSRR